MGKNANQSTKVTLIKSDGLSRTFISVAMERARRAYDRILREHAVDASKCTHTTMSNKKIYKTTGIY